VAGPPAIDLVMFDCDGVLVDSETIANRVLAAALSEAGHPTTEAECRARFIGLSIPSVIARVEAESGHPLPAGFEEALRERDRAAFAAELKAVPGIRDAVARIPLPRCVASSGAPEKIRHSLALTGLLDLFAPHLFSAHAVARGKPAPDLFLHAAAAMGAAPGRTAVVEDSVNGVRAGRAAGMTVFGFAGASHAGAGYGDSLRDAGAAAVFNDMAALPGLLGF